jgi:hypothetical protein
LVYEKLSQEAQLTQEQSRLVTQHFHALLSVQLQKIAKQYMPQLEYERVKIIDLVYKEELPTANRNHKR